MFYPGILLRTVAQVAAFWITLKNGAGRVSQDIGHFCWEHHKATANHKEQTLRFSVFSAFLHTRRCRDLGSLKWSL